MLSNCVPDYPATKVVLHLYVSDVHPVWQQALANGCLPVQEPINKEGDPDIRGSFYDLAGNWWSIAMQIPNTISDFFIRLKHAGLSRNRI